MTRNPLSPHTRAIAMLLLAPMLLSSCYSSRPFDTSAPVPDARIAAVLTRHGSDTMGRQIGAEAVGIEGYLVDTRSEGMRVRLIRVDFERGRSVTWNREEVLFPPGSLLSIRERRLERRRTAAFALAATAAVFLIGRAFGVGGFLFPGEGGGTPPVE